MVDTRSRHCGLGGYRFDAILSHGTAGLLFLSLVVSTDHAAAHWIFLVPPRNHRARGNFVTLLFIFWSGFVGLFKTGDGENPWVIQLSNLAFAIVAISLRASSWFRSLVRPSGRSLKLAREGRADCRDRPHRDHRLVALGFGISRSWDRE